MGSICPCLKKQAQSESITDYKYLDNEKSNKDSNNPSSVQQISLMAERMQLKGENGENLDQNKSFFKVTLADFDILKVLGRGTFGKVLLVQQKNSNKLFAMKVLKKDNIVQKNQVSHTKEERAILETVNHPFIVKLHYAFQSSEKLYMQRKIQFNLVYKTILRQFLHLITDFMIGGELFFHLRRAFKFNEERAKLYTAELVLAIEYLHKRDIVYRDLKPENILLAEDGHLRLTDFGLSKQGMSGNLKFSLTQTDNDITNTFCGTPEYLAPEILLGQGHTKCVDWYSLGALLYEMLSGAPPFYSKDKHKMLRNRLEKPIEMKPWFSNDATTLIQGLLSKEPKYRIGNSGAKEIKQHPFFQEINWKFVEDKVYQPPFKPKIQNDQDLRHFDNMFTKESLQESVSNNQMQSHKNNFQGFTYAPNNYQNVMVGQDQEQEQKDEFDEYAEENPVFSLKNTTIQ